MCDSCCFLPLLSFYLVVSGGGGEEEELPPATFKNTPKWKLLADIYHHQLPGGLYTGDVTYTCAFNDLRNGLQTHCYAPAGLSTYFALLDLPIANNTSNPRQMDRQRLSPG
jgi:hypothetical protein